MRDGLKEVRRIRYKDSKRGEHFPGYIKIFKNGYTEIAVEENEDEIVYCDVTFENELHKYIHWRVILDAGVTLMDIFDVLLFNSTLRDLYSRYYAYDFIKEAITESPDDEYFKDKLHSLQIQKYVEVYNDAYSDSVHFSGEGMDEGKATAFGLGFSNMASIKDVSIELKKANINTIKTKELNCKWLKKVVGKRLYRKLKRKYDTYFLLRGNHVAEFDYEYSLDEIMHAILFEISFYGNPVGKKSRLKEMDEIVEDSKNGNSIPADEFFDRMDDYFDLLDDEK